MISKTKLIIVTIAAFVLLLPAFLRADLTTGLVAYWSFDNCDATDDSGNGNNGTIYGNPQCVDGEKGKAFNFDGTGNYIAAPSPGIPNNSSFTVSYWMKFEWQVHRIWTLYFSNFHALINSDSLYGFSKGITQYGIFDGTQNQFDIEQYQGAWTHVTTIYDADAATLTTYVNATLMDSKPHSGDTIEYNTGLYIGQPHPFWSGDSYYKGDLDEVRIYNRALSEAEIQALYNGGGSPNLQVSPSSHDFGELQIGTCSAVPQQFTLSNTGNADLNVSDISLSDNTNFVLDLNGGDNPCSTNNPSINPGGSCTVTVAFCPSTMIGTINANLTITSNDPDTPIFNVQLTGSGKKLCDPPNVIYTDNSKASGLFEGTAEIKEKGDTAIVDIDLQGTDISPITGGTIHLWTTIDDISFDAACVPTFGPNPDDAIGGEYAEKRIIAPGTHASFRASFCKPGTITFKLGVANLKAVSYTMADIFLTAFGVPIAEIDTFVNDISNPDDFPSINSAMIHIKNAMDFVSERKMGKALKEITLARGDITKLAHDNNQLIKLQLELAKFGIEVGIPKLVLGTFSFATKVIKIFTDVVVYSVQTGFNIKTIQISVVAN